MSDNSGWWPKLITYCSRQMNLFDAFVVSLWAMGALHWALLGLQCGFYAHKCTFVLKEDAHILYENAAQHGPLALGIFASWALIYWHKTGETWRMRYSIGMLALIVVSVVYMSAFLWDGLQGAGESPSTTIRNIGIAIAAVLTLIFVIWRGRIAAGSNQIARNQSLDERYQQASMMLANDNMVVRIAGISLIEQIYSASERYHAMCRRLLSSFVRNATSGQGEDIRMAMATLRRWRSNDHQTQPTDETE